jgi:hypothetical protein
LTIPYTIFGKKVKDDFEMLMLAFWKRRGREGV